MGTYENFVKAAAEQAAANQESKVTGLGGVGGGAYGLGGPGGGYTGLFGTKSGVLQTPLGTFKSDPSWQQLFGSGAQQAMAQQAPTLDNSQAHWQGQQSMLGDMLLQQAQGGGPNLADMQLRQATDRNIAQQFAMSQANPNQAGAMRNIAANTGALNQQAAADSARLRGEMQLGAQGLYGNFMQGARGQDQGWALNQGQMQQQQGQYNQQNAQNYLGMGMGASNTQLQANIAQQQLAAQMNNAAANRENGIIGGLIGGGGAVLGKYMDGKGSTSTPTPAPAPAPTGVVPTASHLAHGGEVDDPYSLEKLYSGPQGLMEAAEAPSPVHHVDTAPSAVGTSYFGLNQPASAVASSGKDSHETGKKVGGTIGTVGGTVVGSYFGPVGGMIGGAVGGALGSTIGGMFAYGGQVPGYAVGGPVGWPSGPMTGGSLQTGQAPSPLWRPPQAAMQSQQMAPQRQPPYGARGGYVPPINAAPAPAPVGIAPPPQGGVYAAGGGYVPGRAAYGGDNPSNDVVPAWLSPGEVVIPRSIAQGDDAPERAKAFVNAIMKKKKKAA